MDAIKDQEQRKAREAESRERGFNDWMRKPEIKLMLSMVPPAENPEAVATLLRSAFDAGHSGGAGNMVGDLIEIMLKSPPKSRD